MHLDQLPHQGETDAQAVAGTVIRALRLGEKLEDARLHFLRHTHPVVGDLDSYPILIDIDR
ncbi:hypothetical protein D9M71_781270 [compost metagenome]